MLQQRRVKVPEQPYPKQSDDFSSIGFIQGHHVAYPCIRAAGSRFFKVVQFDEVICDADYPSVTTSDPAPV